MILWVKSAELLIGRSPRQPGEMPKEDGDVSKTPPCCVFQRKLKLLASQNGFGNDSMHDSCHFSCHFLQVFGSFIDDFVICQRSQLPSLQEAEWFRSMLRTHLAAMQTVQRITQGRGIPGNSESSVKNSDETPELCSFVQIKHFTVDDMMIMFSDNVYIYIYMYIF